MKDAERAGLMSMTGFAATQGSLGGWSWTADIRSVNGRGLDLRLRVPDWIEGLEAELRKLLQARLARGNVTMSVKLARAEEGGRGRLNAGGLEAALEMLGAIREAAERAGLSVDPVSPGEIAAIRGVVDFSETVDEEEVAALKVALLKSAGQCLTAFEADRAREGAALAGVLGEQIGRVETLAAAARAAAGDRDALARATMERSLKRLLDVAEVPDEARMMQELALIAVKTDVTEELDRLAAHVEAARALMAEAGPVGRKFDFLTQEFNREANTLCSKAQATALTAIGLDLKAVIDQMREQVQNVE